MPAKKDLADFKDIIRHMKTSLTTFNFTFFASFIQALPQRYTYANRVENNYIPGCVILPRTNREKEL